MVLKRFTGLLNKRPGEEDGADSSADTPEANAVRGVRLFCESASANSGEEVLHLPTIVEAAVASPSAAAAAAYQIRKFLSKDNFARPHVQYNAVMLIRILADNPGASFTKNFDSKFIDTVKCVLRQGKDPSVQQILRETLDALDREKAYDTNLGGLFAMWRKEAGAGPAMAPRNGSQVPPGPWQNVATNQNSSESYASTSHSQRPHGNAIRQLKLPPPQELAGRIEEARTSAKLLLQLVQSTPPSELQTSDLVREFSERCGQASRSLQGYINADDPAPDDDTMLTLIETTEQLSLAASKHQRAILQARKTYGGAARGNSPIPPPQQPNTAQTVTSPPPVTASGGAPQLPPFSQPSSPPPSAPQITSLSLQDQPPIIQQPRARRQPPTPQQLENPFNDPDSEPDPPAVAYAAPLLPPRSMSGHNNTSLSAASTSPIPQHQHHSRTGSREKTTPVPPTQHAHYQSDPTSPASISTYQSSNYPQPSMLPPTPSQNHINNNTKHNSYSPADHLDIQNPYGNVDLSGPFHPSGSPPPPPQPPRPAESGHARHVSAASSTNRTADWATSQQQQQQYQQDMPQSPPMPPRPQQQQNQQAPQAPAVSYRY